MKFFVTGVSGQLGHDVMLELEKRGYEAIGSDRAGDENAPFKVVPLDITDKEKVHELLKELKPDAVVHCAAWTAVDAAEDEENIPKVRAVNVDGTKNIAEACKEIDAKMVYISTDYVFDEIGRAHV